MSVCSRKLLSHLPKSFNNSEVIVGGTLLCYCLDFVFIFNLQVTQKKKRRLTNKEHASIHFHNSDVNILSDRSSLMAEQSCRWDRKTPNCLSRANSLYGAVVIMCTIILTINGTSFCRQCAIFLQVTDRFIWSSEVMCFRRIRTEIWNSFVWISVSNLFNKRVNFVLWY
jgi:hypothetical protein